MKPNHATGNFELTQEDIKALGAPEFPVEVPLSRADEIMLRASNRLGENAGRTDVTTYIGAARNEAIIDKARTTQALKAILACAGDNLPTLSQNDIDSLFKDGKD